MALVIGFSLFLLIIGSLAAAVAGWLGNDEAVPAATPSPSASPSASKPVASSTPAAPTPSQSRSARPSASAGHSSDPDNPSTSGMVHTGLTGKGTWQTAKLEVAPARKTAAVHRYAVQVEDGTGIDALTAARQISSTLNDPRGWLGHQGNSFQLVKDPAKAQFTIYLASPGRTQKMCPLDVKMTWSCRAGDDVILNTDRWLHQTPTFSDPAAYRAYMVNHEVGHYIGKGHVGCPAKGSRAPVMMQQSKSLGGCRPNPWPADDGR